MIRNKCVVTAALTFAIALSGAFAYAQNQPYIVSFIAGQTGIGLVLVTRTATGIQVGQPRITNLNRAMGSTAVAPVRDGTGSITGYNVYATYTGSTTVPITTSLFNFNLQLQSPGAPTFTETVLTGLRLGQYHPLHLFLAGGVTRLLAAGVVKTAGANDYASYSVNPASGAKKNIFVNAASRTAATAAAAPDGGIISQMTFAGINHSAQDRKLNNGNLAGTPVQVLNVNDFQGYSQSCTNPIAQTAGTAVPATGTRYLAYRNFRLPGTVNGQSQVIVQNIDATTGQLQGAPRAITNFARALNVPAERFQAIAISPDGGLILYAVWSNSCRKQILLASRLSNGSRLGAPKTVIGCNRLGAYPVGVYGVNMAPLSQPASSASD